MRRNVLAVLSTCQQGPQSLQLDVGKVDVAAKLLEESEDFFIEGSHLLNGDHIISICQLREAHQSAGNEVETPDIYCFSDALLAEQKGARRKMTLRLSICNDQNIQFADKLLHIWQLLHHVQHVRMQPAEALLNPVRISVLAEVPHHNEILKRMAHRLRNQLQQGRAGKEDVVDRW